MAKFERKILFLQSYTVPSPPPTHTPVGSACRGVRGNCGGERTLVGRGNLVVKLFSFSTLPLLSVFALFHAIRLLFLFLRNPRSPHNLINHGPGTSAGHCLEQFRIQVRKSLIFYVLSASLYKTSPPLRPNLLDLSTVSQPPFHPSLFPAPTRYFDRFTCAPDSDLRQLISVKPRRSRIAFISNANVQYVRRTGFDYSIAEWPDPS